MKRILVSVLSLMVMSVCLVGCADKTKTEKKSSVSTPGGSSTTTTTTETKKTGDQK
jgi:uncharacterized lipoprotein YehR (DUF1307 family)